ncbi:hypothetical protein [Vagococcus carniphilus]|uniref:hypothetical protein n=1 Tax=Vagococcus carniphilus TaxID=218144 RepID=UPI000F86CCE2|nr:hypothetical protein [Vagococcus carniphilus]
MEIKNSVEVRLVDSLELFPFTIENFIIIIPINSINVVNVIDTIAKVGLSYVAESVLIIIFVRYSDNTSHIKFIEMSVIVQTTESR